MNWNAFLYVWQWPFLFLFTPSFKGKSGVEMGSIRHCYRSIHLFGLPVFVSVLAGNENLNQPVRGMSQNAHQTHGFPGSLHEVCHSEDSFACFPPASQDRQAQSQFFKTLNAFSVAPITEITLWAFEIKNGSLFWEVPLRLYVVTVQSRFSY